MRRYLSFIAVCMSAALAADIPIREVILYKSGVGYFERGGIGALGFQGVGDERCAEVFDGGRPEWRQGHRAPL